MKKYLLLMILTLPFGLLQAKLNSIESKKAQYSEEFKEQLQALLRGSEGVGGGHEVGLSFKAELESALNSLKALDLDSGLNFTQKDLQYKLDQIKIIVVDQSLSLEFKNYIQDSVAVNIPAQNMIVINQTRWSQILDKTLREGIALHEFLSLLEVESTGYYPISSKFVSRKGVLNTQLAELLYVNRLEQIKTMDSHATPHQILEKFYLEAQAPLNWKDIKEVQTNNRIACSSVVKSRWASDQQPTEHNDNYFYKTKLNTYNEIVRESVAANGPLFPGQLAITEPRFYLSFYISAEAPKGATLRVSINEIEQKNADYILSGSLG
ncbi:MAG: hypothetical protein Q7U04_02260, partial [Bacteriovorax sp.]|nr:hypothetical protein [Bacteriovorax sp.]